MALSELYLQSFTQALNSPNSTPHRNGYYVGVLTKNSNLISIDANLVPVEIQCKLPGVAKLQYDVPTPYRYFIKLHRDNHEIEIDQELYEKLVALYEETVKEI